MLREVAVAGLLFPPMLPLMVTTLVLFSLFHWQFERHRIYDFFWHPVLAATALYVILLALMLSLWLLLL